MYEVLVRNIFYNFIKEFCFDSLQSNFEVAFTLALLPWTEGFSTTSIINIFLNFTFSGFRSLTLKLCFTLCCTTKAM